MMTTREPAEVIASSVLLMEASRDLCTHAAKMTNVARQLRAASARIRRSAHAPWIGGAADGPDCAKDRQQTIQRKLDAGIQVLEQARRATIRLKLNDGSLRRDPCAAAVPMWGGSRLCHACDRPLSLGQRGVLATFPDGAIFRFHATCFSAWDSDRQLAGPAPSSPR